MFSQLIKTSIASLLLIYGFGCESKKDLKRNQGKQISKKQSSDDKDSVAINPGETKETKVKDKKTSEADTRPKTPLSGDVMREGEWHLTFEHLNTKEIGLSDEGMSFGLAKALNSVSRSSEVIPIKQVGTKLTYSIDPKLFFPASKNSFRDDPIASINGCSHLKKTKIDGDELIEADSFMYCILEPRIYYRLIGLSFAGNMETAVEAKYLQTQRQQGNHQITCVEKSEVANGASRLMERVERSDGRVFWATADFLNQANLRSALSTGKFPPSTNRSVGTLKAGEFMFEMENGFIGYALSGFGAQSRLEANRAVASDKARSDRFVIAGFGCMRCHSSGFNAGKYIPCGNETETASYPNPTEAKNIILEDNSRVFNTMKKLGYSDDIINGPEPVTAIIDHFEQRTGTSFKEGGASGAYGFGL